MVESTVSLLKKIQDNHITKTCASFVRLLSICMALNDCKNRTSKIFNLFMNRMDGLRADQFRGVHMNDILFVEDLLTLNTVLYDIDSVNGNIIGELAR